jgi:hypothetical protein
MDRETIVSIVKDEFRKHTWDTFIDEPASVAQGRKGVVVPAARTAESESRQSARQPVR